MFKTNCFDNKKFKITYTEQVKHEWTPAIEMFHWMSDWNNEWLIKSDNLTKYYGHVTLRTKDISLLINHVIKRSWSCG